MTLPDGDPDGKDDRRSDQHRRPDPGGRLGAGLFFPVCRQEGVYEQQHEDCAVKTKPPSPGRAGDHYVNATGSVVSGQETVNRKQ